MSDIAPKVWTLDTSRRWNPRTRQHEFVGATSDEGDGSRIVEIETPLRHARALTELVQCRNALILAGITPEALAADAECVKRLVDWSQRTVRVFAEDEVDFADVAAGTASALRACGIKETP